MNRVRVAPTAVVYVRSQTQISTTWSSDPTVSALRDGRGAVGPLPASRFVYQTGPLRNSPYTTRRFLPEDQATALALLERVARERRVPLQTRDLGARWRWGVRRLARRNGWTRFPVLVGPYGRVLSGPDDFNEAAVADALDWRPL